MSSQALASLTATKELETTRIAMKNLQHALQQIYGSSAPTMVIYGSQVRREATSSSDIDVLLIYPHPAKPGTEITHLSGVLADLNLRYEVLVSVLPISQNDYQTAESPLLTQRPHTTIG